MTAKLLLEAIIKFVLGDVLLGLLIFLPASLANSAPKINMVRFQLPGSRFGIVIDCTLHWLLMQIDGMFIIPIKRAPLMGALL